MDFSRRKVHKRCNPCSKHQISNRNLFLAILLDSCTAEFQPYWKLQKFASSTIGWDPNHQSLGRHRCRWRYWQVLNLCAWFFYYACAIKLTQSKKHISKLVSPERILRLPMLSSSRVLNHLFLPIPQQWKVHSAYYRWIYSSTSRYLGDLKTNFIRQLLYIKLWLYNEIHLPNGVAPL